MDEQLRISTPEQVAFHYEVAGIGSRFVASLLDHLIIFVALMLISCAAISLGPVAILGEGTDAAAYWVLAFLVLVYFLIFWGYFVLFEMLWNGQTPGKRSMRLRVIRHSGQPIGGGEAVTRNLVRIIDFMPGFYGIGLISMFIDKDARRLGDFAAGTIVIREGEQTTLRDVRVTPREVPSTEYRVPSGGVGMSGMYGMQEPAAYARPDPLPGVSLRELTPDDYRLIRETLERVRRGELDYGRGQELAAQLAHGVASRLGQDFREWQSRGWTPVVFLESILGAQEARG
jgi:uncharacterized RDD family membrane protein YckC